LPLQGEASGHCLKAKRDIPPFRISSTCLPSLKTATCVVVETPHDSRAKFAYQPKLETFILIKSLLTGLTTPRLRACAIEVPSGFGVEDMSAGVAS
jgi:hypothetical protein